MADRLYTHSPEISPGVFGSIFPEAAPLSSNGLKVYIGAWTEKPLKAYIGGAWLTKSVKRFNGSVWL